MPRQNAQTAGCCCDVGPCCNTDSFIPSSLFVHFDDDDEFTEPLCECGDGTVIELFHVTDILAAPAPCWQTGGSLQADFAAVPWGTCDDTETGTAFDVEVKIKWCCNTPSYPIDAYQHFEITFIPGPTECGRASFSEGQQQINARFSTENCEDIPGDPFEFVSGPNVLIDAACCLQGADIGFTVTIRTTGATE